QSTLSLKFREMVLDALQWQDGEFQFDAVDVTTSLEGLDVRVDLQDIQREGEFRETAWQAIRAVFPSGKARLTVEERWQTEPRAPGGIDERLVQLIRD